MLDSAYAAGFLFHAHLLAQVRKKEWKGQLSRMPKRKTIMILRWLIVYTVGFCFYKHCFHELLDIYGLWLVILQQSLPCFLWSRNACLSCRLRRAGC